MRVLFMPAPAIGHAFPMVPLASALSYAGHEVIFVTGGDGLAVTQAGLVALDALPGLTTPEMLAGFIRDVPELFAPFEGPPIETMDKRKPFIIAAWDPYVDAHVTLGRRLDPDLVVYDPIFAVGPLVAAMLDVPAVAHGIGLSRFAPDMLRDLPAAAGFRRYGLKVPDSIETIDVSPANLADGPPSERAMRYVPYNGGGVLPDWLLTPPRRPRIAVTVGSMLPKIHGFGYVRRIVDAAAEVDAEFVLALGDEQPDEPIGLPANVRTAGWIPLNSLLRTCSAAIHHGGDGTTMTCCALGVPQLVLPNGPERRVNAEVLRARDAAHVLADDELTPTAIGDLLADDRLRAVAGTIRAEIAALPAPADLVPWLASLC